MRTITKTDALALLVRAVAEKGEGYRDQTSSHVYFDRDGLPSCGVGLALSYVGVQRHHLRDPVDGDFNATSVWKLARGRGYALPIVLDDGAIKVLDEFRVKQDSYKPWGEALDAAARI